MKVGILTLKFHSNFGFLMQSYALQKVVKALGHEPFHFYIKEETEPIYNRIIVFFKKIVKNVFFHTNYPLFPYYPSESDRIYKDKNTWDFVHKNISLTPYYPSLKRIRKSSSPLYDAYIVGSDQVWRREFTDDIRCYFFDFLPDNIKRMSYAASFGTPTIDYSDKNLKVCRGLIRKFEKVTVREIEGVKICNEYFNQDAVKVLDPTLLLSSGDYINLIKDPNIPLSKKPYIFTYILRPNEDKAKFISRFAKDRDLEIINIMPSRLEKVGKRHLSECIYPSISDWLKGFSQADYILTDSFHASVFSIIFHKQFYVINDKDGGSTRIPSLLKTLSIEHRFDCDYNGQIFDIDYEKVDKILERERASSINLIKSFLS